MNNLPAYAKKSDDALRYILKDASEAAIAMRGHSPESEAKYLDQVNDASTVLAQRAAKKPARPRPALDWICNECGKRMTLRTAERGECPKCGGADIDMMTL